MTTSKPRFTILDTGPCLNFMGTGATDILLGVLEVISAKILIPEDVEDEVALKSEEIVVYTRAIRGLQGAERLKRITVATARTGKDPELDRWVSKIFGFPHEKIAYRAKDRGEMMAVAHGAALEEQGQPVFIVINDQGGTDLAHAHGLHTFSTLAILRKAALLGLIVDREHMAEVFGKMRPLDGALRNLPARPVELFGDDLKYGIEAHRVTAHSEEKTA